MGNILMVRSASSSQFQPLPLPIITHLVQPLLFLLSLPFLEFVFSSSSNKSKSSSMLEFCLQQQQQQKQVQLNAVSNLKKVSSLMAFPDGLASSHALFSPRHIYKNNFLRQESGYSCTSVNIIFFLNGASSSQAHLPSLPHIFFYMVQVEIDKEQGCKRVELERVGVGSAQLI